MIYRWCTINTLSLDVYIQNQSVTFYHSSFACSFTNKSIRTKLILYTETVLAFSTTETRSSSLTRIRKYMLEFDPIPATEPNCENVTLLAVTKVRLPPRPSRYQACSFAGDEKKVSAIRRILPGNISDSWIRRSTMVVEGLRLVRLRETGITTLTVFHAIAAPVAISPSFFLCRNFATGRGQGCSVFCDKNGPTLLDSQRCSSSFLLRIMLFRKLMRQTARMCR